MTVLEHILEPGVIFVLRGSSAREVVEDGLALAAHGARVLEVTWTVPEAVDALRELRERTSVTAVGMGTVTSAEQARRASSAGAEFLVTPGFHEPTVRAALEASSAVLPGVATAGEVMSALELGLRVLKLFPAATDPSMLGLLSGPFPDVRWVPSGGVGPENAAEWFAAGASAIGVGSAVQRLPEAEMRRTVPTLHEVAARHRQQ